MANKNSIVGRIRILHEGDVRIARRSPQVYIDDELQRNAKKKPSEDGSAPKSTKHVVPKAVKGKVANISPRSVEGMVAFEQKARDYLTSRGYVWIGEEQGETLLDSLIKSGIRRAQENNRGVGHTDQYYQDVLSEGQFNERIFASFVGRIGVGDAYRESNAYALLGDWFLESQANGYVISTKELETQAVDEGAGNITVEEIEGE